MESSEIKCPVCGLMHNIAQLCPQCGFEYHLMLTPPGELLQAAEERRLNDARTRWNQLQEMKASQSQGKLPLGFLITERFVVYCLQEGRNVLGAPGGKLAEDESYIELIFPGITLCQQHFVIDAQFSEDKKKVNFSISLLTTDASTSIFINTLTRPLTDESIALDTNDNIIICLGSGTGDNNVVLKFRKNLNR